MRAVVQRVDGARVTVDGETVGSIGRGVVVLLAVHGDDGQEDLAFIKKKLVNLRIFNDSAGKMNLSVKEVGGAMLLVSQFTLYGDCRKGNRPSYSRSAGPGLAEELYDSLVQEIGADGIDVATGRFQAMMKVELVNDGPVTLIIDSMMGV
jgi:D-tyrosyl-tRNA(Tyr) deacylase